MRPRGNPPIPSARSRPSEPDGITSICSSPDLAPIRMIEPFPKARSICVIAASSALFFSIRHHPWFDTSSDILVGLHVQGSLRNQHVYNVWVSDHARSAPFVLILF